MGSNKIDYGKISALHNAGWAGSKISDELRLSREEYCDALTGILDILDEKIMHLEQNYRDIVEMLKS